MPGGVCEKNRFDRLLNFTQWLCLFKLQLSKTKKYMKYISIIKDLVKDPAAIRDYFKKKYRWSKDSGGFARKNYRSYDEYLKHQKSKLEEIKKGRVWWFGDYDNRYREALKARLEEAGMVHRGDTVLCLAARLGTEVRAFIDLGCFAIGLDLNPGEENKHVVHGDFHHIQYADHSVDVIFCNSLDHAYDLDKLFSEVKRVLAPEGILILEINVNTDEGTTDAGYYESFAWSSTESLIKLLEGYGLKRIKSSSFDYPWKGEHAYFAFQSFRST